MKTYQIDLTFSTQVVIKIAFFEGEWDQLLFTEYCPYIWVHSHRYKNCYLTDTWYLSTIISLHDGSSPFNTLYISKIVFKISAFFFFVILTHWLLKKQTGNSACKLGFWNVDFWHFSDTCWFIVGYLHGLPMIPDLSILA